MGKQRLNIKGGYWRKKIKQMGDKQAFRRFGVLIKNKRGSWNALYNKF